MAWRLHGNAFVLIDGHKLGVTLAVFIGGWHLVWSALVLLRWAQPVLDFVFWLHFIDPPYRIGTFAPWRAAGLIALTAILGYVFGRALGALWNANAPLLTGRR